VTIAGTWRPRGIQLGKHPTTPYTEHSDVPLYSYDFFYTAIMSHRNFFSVEDDRTIFNLITLAWVPEQYLLQILNLDDIGQKMYNHYTKENINESVSIWAPVKKRKSHLHFW